MTRLVLACWLLFSVIGIAQQPVAPDPFEPLAFLIGNWEGTSDGQPGKGTVQRRYERVLNNRFIRAHTRSEYPAQAKNPKGETHEDEGWFSFDKARKRLVLRSSSTKIVFTSEGIENIPAGYRARETYLVKSADAFEEIFEIAEPNKPFDVYSRTALTRVR